MNREIKFRAWSEYENKMYNLIGITPTECIIYEESDKMNAPKELFRTGIDTLKIMQFIGLKDLQGHEIYEGDFLQTYRDEKHELKGDMKIVEWSDNIANCGCCSQIIASGFDLEHDTDMVEIIGNIYENPELLKNE
jgi:uncharacterized phage protein (TIGR01671 family)